MEQQIIELEITPERLDELTWEQWEIIDRLPNLNNSDARSIISVFMKGKTPEEGFAALGKLKTQQMNKTLYAFAEAVTKLKSVNPPTGG